MKALIFVSLMFLSCLFISFASHHNSIEKKEATGEVAFQQHAPKLLIGIARTTKYYYTSDTLFHYEREFLVCPD